MIWTAFYFLAVLFIAYRIGGSSGPSGVIFFLVAFVLHQTYVFGPESLLGSCVDWDGRGNPDC